MNIGFPWISALFEFRYGSLRVNHNVPHPPIKSPSSLIMTNLWNYRNSLGNFQDSFGELRLFFKVVGDMDYQTFYFPNFLPSLPVKTLFDWSSWLSLLKRQSLAIRFHTIWFPATLLSLSINYLSIWSWSAVVDWEGLGDETCNWGWGDCGLHNAALTVVP